MIKKEYTHGELTVVWQPDLCIHSAICFHNLPEVFKPRERPWIQMENADLVAIESTVRACPSGAISIKPVENKQDEIVHPSMEGHHIHIIANGPVRFKESCKITLQDGSVVEKPNGVSICRCGNSAKYPFCDGSHRTNGFIG